MAFAARLTAASTTSAGAPLSAWKAAAWRRRSATHTFKTDDGEIALKCPTEIAITTAAKSSPSDPVCPARALQRT